MMKFRQHRGGLAESMETCVDIEPTHDALLRHLLDVRKDLPEPLNSVGELQVKIYGWKDDTTPHPDTRIGWDAVYVVMEKDGQGNFVTGFTDGPLLDSERSVDGSYTVQGIYYSAYTNEKAKPITLSEAAKMAGVTPRTLRKWLKTPTAPRQILLENGIHLLDYEVQFWLDNVVNRKYPERTWKRALKNLRDLVLIRKDTLIQKLEERRDREWTDLQRRVNRFDDSHVEAYRRGVSDALWIVKSHGIEVWDYVPKIGQIISVGACGGTITKITDDEIVVNGTYFYYAGEGKPGYPEDWRFTYKLADVLNADVRPWWPGFDKRRKKEDDIAWNYEGIPHTSQ